MIPGRKTAKILGLILLMGGLAACATAPATGKRIFTGGMSLADEKNIGAREHPKILEQFGGVYEDKRLAAYVDRIGRNLARTSELPDLGFTFTILNSDQVNAFALPGGYVYVTRGLMALAGDEAELAGVIAHEIGHVTARHSAERYGDTLAAGIGATLCHSGVRRGRRGLWDGSQSGAAWIFPAAGIRSGFPGRAIPQPHRICGRSHGQLSYPNAGPWRAGSENKG